MKTTFGGMAKLEAVRFFAILSLIFAAGLLLLALLNLRSRIVYSGPKWWPPLLCFSVYWGVLGVGMLYSRKWVVAVFTISTTGVGLLLVIYPMILGVRSGNVWVLANVPIGIGLCLTLIPAVACWNELK